MQEMLLLSLLLTIVGLQMYSSAGEKHAISLLSLLPYHNPEPSLNPSWNDGQNIQPAMELARDQINNSSALLQNYTLCLLFAEGGCNQVGRTTVSFVMHAGIGRDENLMGIIGPGCSASTLGLAPLTNRSELGLVMVHASGSSTLEEKHNEYKYLLGTLGSTRNFVRGFLYLLEEAQWKRIAILFDELRPYHLDTKKELVSQIPPKVNIVFSSPVSFTHLPLDVIKHSLIRIIYVLCPTELSQQILCLSHHKNMTYDNYQWVYMSQVLEQLAEPVEFVYEGVMYKCSKEEMEIALEQMLLMTYNLKPSVKEKEAPISNISYHEYLKYYKKYREQYEIESGMSSVYTFWSTFLYDTVWAWAIVLNNLTKSNSLELNNTEYGRLSQSEMIVEQFYATTFQGMSGRINFNRRTGFTDRQMNISQVANRSERTTVVVGVTEEKKLPLHLIPDSFPTVQENIAVSFVFIFIILCQLVVDVCLHIFTGFNARKPSVKASSIKMLHISYIGTYVLVLGAIVYSLKSIQLLSPEARCGLTMLLWAWFLPIGFTLAFGPVAVRTWRLYRIFIHYKNPGPFISDPMLLMGIGLLLLVDLAVGLTWTVLDPFRAEISIMVGTSVNVKYVCNCEKYFLWLGLVTGHKAGILVLVTLLAVLTRAIPNPSFTTDALRVLTYITSIIFGICISLHYIFYSSGYSLNANFITVLFLLNCIICTFISCVFIPPAAPLLKTYLQSKLKTNISVH